MEASQIEGGVKWGGGAIAVSLLSILLGSRSAHGLSLNMCAQSGGAASVLAGVKSSYLGKAFEMAFPAVVFHAPTSERRAHTGTLAPEFTASFKE